MSSSAENRPAVDVEDLAGDERREVGAQEEHRPGYLVGGGDAAERGGFADGGALAVEGVAAHVGVDPPGGDGVEDRKSTRLNSSHGYISYAVFCLKKNK